jgi:drug/metabolite transporter (DMT)-like permease
MHIRIVPEDAKTRKLASVGSLLLFVILLKPFSNLFIAWGVRHISQTLSLHPWLLLRALLDPFVMLGVMMQLTWMLGRMTLLGMVDLSLVLPVTAIGYVISTTLGEMFLHEHVGTEDWIGVFFIFTGTVCAGSSAVAKKEVTDSDAALLTGIRNKRDKD